MHSSPEKISKITDNIYLGGYYYMENSQCVLVKLLRERNVTDVINCAEEIGFYLPMEEHINYIKFSWEDLSEFQLFPSILEAESHLNKLVQLNKIVYVHCAMGLSRSVSLVLFHLMLRHNLTLEQACSFVREKRKIIVPNWGFLQQIKSYFQSRQQYNGNIKS